MSRHYFELRKDSMHGSLSTDMMRHLHTRQHLGKALVISDQQRITLSAARKQWLKLTRNVQRRRAGTLNADKILKYTHTVTHMQNMRFTSKLPLNEPEADVYFLANSSLKNVPVHCFTVYIISKPPRHELITMLQQLPSGALIVDYRNASVWPTLNLKPKALLEKEVETEWQQVQQFLATYHINLPLLVEGSATNLERMEEALDILLGANHKFLQIAGDFQRALELARPLRLTKEIREHYDAAILLAHRVQALTPGVFTQSFLETYNEDDTFFLYDSAKDLAFLIGDSLSEAIDRHIKANRLHLAAALKQYHLAH